MKLKTAITYIQKKMSVSESQEEYMKGYISGKILVFLIDTEKDTYFFHESIE